ncbi:DedA family protein [Lysinimonas soli]|uniref:DedA family protein n=1 Tax=Lysinimonas soli TaxID=1074233 RepID=A0ABW0NQB8_9MICO
MIPALLHPALLHPVSGLIPWLDPKNLIEGFGVWALVVVCAFVFAETGLLVGFVLPGDTLLVISGVLAFPGAKQIIHIDIWWVCLAIAGAAFLGGEVGYLIGHKAGPRIFERKESGFFSRANVERTNAFFTRFGGLAVIAARFVPIVRTFAPVAAGVGHMPYRRYSLYNAVGALIWGAGLTFAGYLLNYIPPVRDFVTSYIDVILLGAVCIAIVPTAYHTIRSTIAARRARAAGVAPLDESDVVLDPKIFDDKA